LTPTSEVGTSIVVILPLTILDGFATIILSTGKALIVITLDSLLIVDGLEAITRTLYKAAAVAPAGIVSAIGLVPTWVALGVTNEPAASES
jgi:hypothetical protein